MIRREILGIDGNTAMMKAASCQGEREEEQGYIEGRRHRD